MPFSNESFNVVICGLATHHMNVPHALRNEPSTETWRALTVSDVGGSPRWQLPGVRTLIKIAVFTSWLQKTSIERGLKHQLYPMFTHLRSGKYYCENLDLRIFKLLNCQKVILGYRHHY